VNDPRQVFAGGAPLSASVLDEIVASTRQDLDRRRSRIPLSSVVAAASASPQARRFAAAIEGSEGVALIAEVKQRSPSRGLLCADFDPVAIAKEYAAAGAAAISCLTNESHFGGRLEHIGQIADACDLPILRKDFVIDPYQVYESRAARADAVLLIAAILPMDRLRELHDLAGALGMAALVEVHTEAETRSALDAGARLIGVNNRNLHDFSIDLDTTARLRAVIPADVIVVSESGIGSAADVARLRDLGVNAILVGERLMTAPDRSAAVRWLLGRE
jgi:indole-3-glycerol phosphate synthase